MGVHVVRWLRPAGRKGNKRTQRKHLDTIARESLIFELVLIEWARLKIARHQAPRQTAMVTVGEVLNCSAPRVEDFVRSVRARGPATEVETVVHAMLRDRDYFEWKRRVLLWQLDKGPPPPAVAELPK